MREGTWLPHQLYESTTASITTEIDVLTSMLSDGLVGDDRRAFMVGAINALAWIRDGMDKPSQWLNSTPTS